MTLKEFSPWFDVEQLDPVVLATASFVYQIKDASQLFIYTTGRSAMLFYGETDTATAIDDVVQSIRMRYPRARLRFRYRPETDTAQSLADLLDRFERRFGSLPHGNQAMKD